MSRAKSTDTVYQTVRAWIANGTLQAGEFVPGERELVQKFGVSRATIQSAFKLLLRDGALVREPNCRPVVAKMNMEPVQVRNEIAVWIQPDLQHIGAAGILQGIRFAVGDEFALLIGFPPAGAGAKTPEFEFLKNLAKNPRVAGAIVWEAQGLGFTSVYLGLHEANIPVVFIDREPPEIIEADVVSTNNKRGAKKAVDHLISQGHRSIAMVINDESASSVRDRLDGYRAALADAEIPFNPDLIFEVEIDSWPNLPGGPIGFAKKVIGTNPAPTAIFCVNDGTALRLVETLRNMDVKIPEQISIVGFDWISRLLPSGGELTTIAQPFEAIGRVAAQRLIERIKQKTPNVPRHILLEAPLIVRATTGAPPASALKAEDLITRSHV